MRSSIKLEMTKKLGNKQFPRYLASIDTSTMDIHQVESSAALLLPDLVALLASLSDTNDAGDVLLLKQVRFPPALSLNKSIYPSNSQANLMVYRYRLYRHASSPYKPQYRPWKVQIALWLNSSPYMIVYCMNLSKESTEKVFYQYLLITRSHLT